MASKKDLRKDIRYIYSELLTDWFTISIANSSVDDAKMDACFKTIVNDNVEMLNQVNKAPKKADKKTIKAFYKGIDKALSNSILKISEEFASITKATK